MSEASTNPKDLIEISLPGDSVLIRELSLADAQAYFDLLNYDREHLSQFGDETAAKYQTVEDVEESIRNPKPNKFRFGIWDDDVMVGTNNLRVFGSSGETGSWIGAEHTGHNYAARGRAPLLQFAFREIGLERVISFIAVGNEASKKSIENSGYSFVNEKGGYWLFEMRREDYGN